MVLLAALPLVAALGLAALAGWRLGLEWRRALLAALIGCGVVAAIGCEVLSLFQQLNSTSLVYLWGLTCLALGAWNRDLPARPFCKPPPLDQWERLLATALGVLAVSVILAAILPMPNSADGLAYHLPRFRHWLMQGSLEHFPTTIPRQLYMSPGAEYQLLTLWGLTASTRLLACVEVGAWMGCILAASVLAQQLGASRRLQWTTALLVASQPMGILQASSTQNNGTGALWLALAVMALFEIRNNDINNRSNKKSWGWLLVAAAAVGLSLATKATTFLFGAPFGIWGAYLLWKHWGKQAWQPALATTAIVLLLGAPGFVRNAQVFQSPFGPESAAYSNAPIGPTALATNIVRNTASHMGAPLPFYNQALTSAVYLFERIGLPVNGEDFTWRDSDFYVSGEQTEEGFAGAPIQFLMMIGALGYSFRRRRRAPLQQTAFQTLALCFLAFLLFCLYLRWQPWGTRLTLPLFVIALPAATVALAKGSRLFVPAATLCAFFLALPAALTCELRPLLGANNIFASTAQQELFRADPTWSNEHVQVMNALISDQAQRVGLIADPLALEYRLWALRDAANATLDFEYVANPFLPLYGPTPAENWQPPEHIVLMEVPVTEAFEIAGRRYEEVLNGESIALFKRQSETP
jgi:hypothetical protein